MQRTTALLVLVLPFSLFGCTCAAPVRNVQTAAAAGSLVVTPHSLTHLVFKTTQQHCVGGSAQEHFFLFPSAPVTCEKVNEAATLKASRWSCRLSGALVAAFLRVHHARVHCDGVADGVVDKTLCSLDYWLDYSLLAVFLLGFAATALCGTCIAIAMYLAVLRMMAGYNELVNDGQRRYIGKGILREEEKLPLFQVENSVSKPVPVPNAADECYLAKPLGYGSFGRKLEVIGGFSGSFSSLVEMSPMPSPPRSPPPSPPPEEEDPELVEVEEGFADRIRREHRERVALLETELCMG